MPVAGQWISHIPPETGAWLAAWSGYEVSSLTYRADHGGMWEQSSNGWAGHVLSGTEDTVMMQVCAWL